ncbi:MAG: imidazole glycerol phosphate synthase cyclase subunit [Oligoflexia bacterium]|nr:imidazole glycerol phosphate synthase cyclase subunit [Oligoflexia bacterium]
MNGLIRVVPRLDIKGSNIVKGIQFDGYRVVGLAEEVAELYYNEGADELIYQDTVASLYRRSIDLDVVKKTAKRAFIPLTVAGGLRTLEDIKSVLRSGADKVAINTAAVDQPQLIREASRVFGSQCIVASLEVFRRYDGRCEIWTDYGRQRTGIEAISWAKKMVELGAGEIMLSSINQEGTGRGYDWELTRDISTNVPVPVIACGGAGSVDDFFVVASQGGASAISASSIFHYHYAKSLDKEHLKSRYCLRSGQQIDTGNVDFMMEGYGGIREFQVMPASIKKVKSALLEAGMRVRV